MATSRRAERSRGRLATTAIAVSASLAGGVWLLLSNAGARVDRDPARAYASLPGDAAEVVRQTPAALSQLTRTPIDADAFNLVYVATAKRFGVQSPRARQAAAILSRYGWRSAAAQQNLIEDAAYRADYPDVLDRVDAMMRRDKRRPQMALVLAALEQDPNIQPQVVQRLAGHPNWRQDYLWRIGDSPSPGLLDARVRTLNALLDRGDRLSREEVSRSLQALIAGNRAAAANRLWRRVSGASADHNLLYDPQFRIAVREGVRPAFGIPYEWALQSGVGYSATLQGGEWPLRIEWSGAAAGLPVFARQVLALPAPMREFELFVAAEQPTLAQSNLDFTLGCDGREARFEARGVRGSMAVYRLAGGVPSCLTPTFSIVGRSTGSASEPLLISSLRLIGR